MSAELTLALSLAREVLARRGALGDTIAPDQPAIGEIVNRALGWFPGPGNAMRRAPLLPALDAATRLRRKRARKLSKQLRKMREEW